MRDDAHTLHPKQRGSAVFRMIKPLLEVGKRATRQHVANLPRNCCPERLFERGTDQLRDPLRGFQRNVAHKSISDDYIHAAAIDVASFHIPDKIQRKLLEQGECLAGEFIALGLFLPDGEQADSRTLGAEDFSAVSLTHYGELLQVLRLAIDVGANVEQDRGGSQRRRKNCGQRWTVYARQGAKNHLGGSHGRPGIPRTHKARGLSFAYQSQANLHGRVALGTHGMRRLLRHANNFAGVHNFKRLPRGRAMAVELGFDLRFRTDQEHTNAELARGLQRALDFRLGRAIRTHRIQSYGAWHGVRGVGGVSWLPWPRSLRGLYSSRILGRRGEAFSAHGSWGIQIVNAG